MFDLFGKMVTRWWWAVIVFWIALTVGIKLTAPRWDDITYDGDLAYLPATMPSYVGEQLLSEAFPKDRAKSQIVLIAARDAGELSPEDLDVAMDIARRFKNYQGITALNRAKKFAAEASAAAKPEDADHLQKRALSALESSEKAFDEAIELDEQLVRHHEKRAEKNEKPNPPPEQLAEAYWNRALLYEYLDQFHKDDRDYATHEREIESDRNLALKLAPGIPAEVDAALKLRAAQGNHEKTVLFPEAAEDIPLLDVWTWRDEIFGEKLGANNKQAKLVVLQLANEFMATENIRTLKQVERELTPVKKFADQLGLAKSIQPDDNLQIGISGSASVGGDMLRSAHESIKHTELFTVVIVVLILLCVYRSPLLVIVPLITIFVSLQVATGTIALLTQLNFVPGFSWWDLKVFTTTKIFIVVILFGSGTDFCLFLISRFKEELEHGYKLSEANAKALGAIADALIASAMTTILGLGMMFFADFGKYRNSGPVIGLCLFVTLLACLTLAPALLRACGTWLFWPMKVKPRTGEEKPGVLDAFWQKSARWIVAYPVPILIGSVLILFPAAWHGWQSGEHVTYDFLSGLADSSPSKSGTKLLQRHFPVGESGPILVVIKRPFEDKNNDFNQNNKEGRKELAKLTKELYLPGVTSIRSVVDPRGELTPGAKQASEEAPKPKGGLKAFARRAVEKAHRRTAELYVSQTPELAGQVTRLEMILDRDPFDIESLQTLNRIDDKLTEIKNQPDSYWKDATFAYAGATAGVRDLRKVTRNDNQRIQLLVVIAVYLVLLAVLRRPLVCLYMILSVLFSYYVTIGATEAFFGWCYGPTYPGLDWKVPLFLFVILVAVGEDYNVYLATRVYEEQRRHGPFSGLRKAIVRTGGIITSCGVIMAGTFVSMTAGVWGELLPASISKMFFADDVGALRGIVELGVALTLGVMLDTFIVRPILVPAFMALLAQWEITRPRKARPRRRLARGPHRARVAEGAGRN
jgi:RND superfamily putative drug exporter